MYLMLFIYSVLGVTSFITLGFTLNYMTDAKEGIVVADLTYTRFNDMASARLLYRQILNIANGYTNNSDEIISDKFSVYS
jgi:hypothetical protein